MRMLFVTQRIDPLHDDLGFVPQWIGEFQAQGYDVEVACLQGDGQEHEFLVHDLGKGRNRLRASWAANFMKVASQGRFDRVFIHMNPVYFSLMGWSWHLRRVPSYLWYTHYTDHIHMKIAARTSRRMFAATEQSMPQYRGNPKRVITGHGIDTSFWNLGAVSDLPGREEKHLLMVHRLSRSKRVEIGIAALSELPEDYRLTIVGSAIDPEYFDELRKLVTSLGLDDRVEFRGPMTMRQLRQTYAGHSLMINMAPETIDKTVLEAIRMGTIPLTTRANALAVGDARFGAPEDPSGLAEAISRGEWRTIDSSKAAAMVEQRHGLARLVTSMRRYIDEGI